MSAGQWPVTSGLAGLEKSAGPGTDRGQWGAGQWSSTLCSSAKLSGPTDYLTLVLFVLLSTASFLYLELYATFAPAAAGVKLEARRTWLDTHREQVIILVSLLLGLWLVGNSLYYLA
jgi:hypothetical protein